MSHINVKGSVRNPLTEAGHTNHTKNKYSTYITLLWHCELAVSLGPSLGIILSPRHSSRIRRRANFLFFSAIWQSVSCCEDEERHCQPS